MSLKDQYKYETLYGGNELVKDQYKIKECPTAPDGQQFAVYETFGGNELVLEHKPTRLEAEKAVKEWETRDLITEKAEDFIQEMLDDYGSILDCDEIRSCIKEAC